jgi:hypothetical protein
MPLNTKHIKKSKTEISWHNFCMYLVKNYQKLTMIPRKIKWLQYSTKLETACHKIPQLHIVSTSFSFIKQPLYVTNDSVKE